MKKITMLFAAVIIMAGFSINVMAQTGTSSTVAATAAGAKLVIPMTLTQTSPLHFGTINIMALAGGTVVLPSNSTTRTFPLGGVSASAVAPLATNAAYTVAGTMNTTYALTLPATITVTETVGNSVTMTISDLTARFNGAGSDAITSTLSGSGTGSFTVGGTLTVPATATGGIYAGSFPVTVDYN